jgi:hypothetical protein
VNPRLHSKLLPSPVSGKFRPTYFSSAASIGEVLSGVLFFLMESPTDAGDDLESADGAGEGSLGVGA